MRRRLRPRTGSSAMDTAERWCCQTGLNCRPLHYQWSALPLSYGSMPGTSENRPKRPHMAADPCHKAPACASARRHQNRPQISVGPLLPAAFGAVAGRAGSVRAVEEERSASAPDNRLFCAGHDPERRSNRSTMADAKDKHRGQRPPSATDSRQDRLKLALRENLKRRKSQARGRSDATIAPSSGDDVPPHEAGGKKPDK